MLWWNWNVRQKFALLTGMLTLAALPCVFLGWLPHQLGAFLGGTSFLLIPQLVGWQLFVGLKTGIMPQRGAKVSRADSPINFWITGGMYGARLAFFVWIILMVLLDMTKPLQCPLPTIIGRSALLSQDWPLPPKPGRLRYPKHLPIADIRIIVNGEAMKALIPFALLAAIPTLAHADPVATGPFYLPQDAAAADREEITTVIINAQKLTNGTIHLCSTSASLPVGRQNQRAVRAELTANGVSSAMIRVGRRCGTALRHPHVSKAAKDAVVAIVGPSGR